MRPYIRFCGPFALAALAACSKTPPPPGPIDHPALWRIAKDGRHAWLFGTIHALPKGARWQSPELSAAMAESDRLVIEATGLQDQVQVQKDFDAIAKSPGLPPLSMRIPPASRADLAKALKRMGGDEKSMSAYESWGAAIMISSVLTGDISDEGVEQKLLKRFGTDRKPVEGLETIKQQFAYLDAMKPDAQNHFLAATVDEPGDTASELKGTYDAWRRGDLATIARQTKDELDASPEVREPLLTARNRNWAAEMDAVMKRPGTPFIAVGSGHLVGPDNLIDMLKKQGFEISRSE